MAAGERARIVRWLRWMDRRASRDPAAKAAIDKVCARDCGSSVADIAAAIEHGDYVSYETPRTYQAECDACGARGPTRDNEASAIEGVTASAHPPSTYSRRWRIFRGSLMCPGCADRVESQTR